MHRLSLLWQFSYFCGCFIKCTCLDPISKLVRPTTLSLRKILGSSLVAHSYTRRDTWKGHCSLHTACRAASAQMVGHVIQMQSNWLRQRTLYSELQHGKRATGGQKKRFSDHVKAPCGSAQFFLISWRQKSVAGRVWGGPGSLRHELWPWGRSSSRPSTHGHKRTCLCTAALHVCDCRICTSASSGCGVISAAVIAHHWPASAVSSSFATDTSKQAPLLANLSGKLLILFLMHRRSNNIL